MNYKKIAALANVGVGTVSRYFNNGSITQKNIDKIEKVVQKYNFKPQFRVLSRSSIDNSIYVVLTSLNEAFVNDIVEGLNSKLNNNQQVIIIKSSLEPEKYLKSLQKLMKQKPTKLLLFLPKLNDKILKYIQNLKNILVIAYGKKIEEVFSIYVDESYAIENLTQQFIDKIKPEKIAFIGKDISDLTTGKQRYWAFKNIAAQNNIKSKTFLVDNNHPQVIKEAFKKATLENFTNIICGTHTIFTTCSLLNKNPDLKLTDIGYSNFLDKEKSYTFKIFIDFFLIGILIGEIFEGKNNNKVIKIKPEIIE